jgi:hypothetical protein
MVCVAPLRFSLVYADILFIHCNKALAWYFTDPWLAKTITLIILPFGLMSIPAGFYWIVKRARMPYFLELSWALWIIFITSNLLIH